MKNYEESFDDIVFQNRNKDYGAYSLRKTYSGRGSIALFFALGIFVLVVVGPFLYNRTSKTSNFQMDDIYNGYHEIEFKAFVQADPLPKLPSSGQKLNQDFTLSKFVDTVYENEREIPAVIEIAEGGKYKDFDTSGYQIQYAPEPDPIIDEEYFTTVTVHEKPIYQGGYSKLLEYLANHAKYPVTAIEKNIEGTVYIRFLVSKTGKIGEAKVLRSVDVDLDEEALRVVKSMPEWIPGKVNGHPVNVWFIVPVKFVLKF